MTWVAVLCIGVYCTTLADVANHPTADLHISATREECETNRRTLVDMNREKILYAIKWGKHVVTGCREIEGKR